MIRSTVQWMGQLAQEMTSSNSAELRNSDKALKLATKACELTKYHNPRWLCALAGCSAANGDFTSAVKWYDRAFESSGNKPEDAFRRLLCHLKTNDLDGYRAGCTSMLKSYAAATDDVTNFWVAWTCLLAPANVDDLQVAVANAQELVSKHPQETQYQVALAPCSTAQSNTRKPSNSFLKRLLHW